MVPAGSAGVAEGCAAVGAAGALGSTVVVRDEARVENRRAAGLTEATAGGRACFLARTIRGAGRAGGRRGGFAGRARGHAGLWVGGGEAGHTAAIGARVALATLGTSGPALRTARAETIGVGFGANAADAAGPARGAAQGAETGVRGKAVAHRRRVLARRDENALAAVLAQLAATLARVDAAKVAVPAFKRGVRAFAARTARVAENPTSHAAARGRAFVVEFSCAGDIGRRARTCRPVGDDRAAGLIEVAATAAAVLALPIVDGVEDTVTAVRHTTVGEAAPTVAGAAGATVFPWATALRAQAVRASDSGRANGACDAGVGVGRSGAADFAQSAAGRASPAPTKQAGGTCGRGAATAGLGLTAAVRAVTGHASAARGATIWRDSAAAGSHLGHAAAVEAAAVGLAGVARAAGGARLAAGGAQRVGRVPVADQSAGRADVARDPTGGVGEGAAERSRAVAAWVACGAEACGAGSRATGGSVGI